MYSSLPSCDTTEYNGSLKNGASNIFRFSRYEIAFYVRGFFIEESRIDFSLKMLGSDSLLAGVHATEDSEVLQPDFKNKSTYSLCIESQSDPERSFKNFMPDSAVLQFQQQKLAVLVYHHPRFLVDDFRESPQIGHLKLILSPTQMCGYGKYQTIFSFKNYMYSYDSINALSSMHVFVYLALQHLISNLVKQLYIVF